MCKEKESVCRFLLFKLDSIAMIPTVSSFKNILFLKDFNQPVLTTMSNVYF